ncbi:MAG TPA: proton-conducting transporter membrane subunit, partial [Methanomassiliicoccaceae archaeon]|nr:proton-conducting transporter membrane subunit [Methanomassiliicoccaceae archaeon]
MFMIGLFVFFIGFQGNLDYTHIFNNVDAFVGGDALLTFGTLMIFGGAIGKSAQFPLHDWLPDAMEGPTTVSALIHAATMVKAGVYLVARSYPVMVETPDTMLFIAFIGGFTALFAATMALNNTNIKRVLAYSTVSQLGYMFLALGAGGYIYYYHADFNVGYAAGTFHLMNHAFFKALLFLSAGAVIHAAHTEDMRLMGGLSKKLKITSLVMLIGCISIAGIPPFSGFWSKDLVLEAAFEGIQYNGLFILLYAFGLITAFLTAFYMFRLWFLTFAGKPRDQHTYDHAHEAPKVMWVPLAILAVLAFGSGFAFLMGFESVLVPGLEGFVPHEAS